MLLFVVRLFPPSISRVTPHGHLLGSLTISLDFFVASWMDYHISKESQCKFFLFPCSLFLSHFTPNIFFPDPIVLDVIEKLKKTNYSLAKDNTQHKRVIGEMQSKNIDLARKNYELVVQVTQLMVANRALQPTGKEQQPKGVTAALDRQEQLKGRPLAKKPVLATHKPQLTTTAARDDSSQPVKVPTKNVTTRTMKKPLSLNITSRPHQVSGLGSCRQKNDILLSLPFPLQLTKDPAISKASPAPTLPQRCQCPFLPLWCDFVKQTRCAAVSQCQQASSPF